jgi:hypothetical protein
MNILDIDRAAFEDWYVLNAFDYENNPIGSRDFTLMWKGWSEAVKRLTQTVDVTNQTETPIGYKPIDLKIDIAKYYPYPAGRYKKDGPQSGEGFRCDYLYKSLKERKVILLELDNTAGYGSSFLEECFGGLVRMGIAYEDMRKQLILRTNDNDLYREIWEYIEDQRDRDNKKLTTTDVSNSVYMSPLTTSQLIETSFNTGDKTS